MLYFKDISLSNPVYFNPRLEKEYLIKEHSKIIIPFKIFGGSEGGWCEIWQGRDGNVVSAVFSFDSPKGNSGFQFMPFILWTLYIGNTLLIIFCDSRMNPLHFYPSCY